MRSTFLRPSVVAFVLAGGLAVAACNSSSAFEATSPNKAADPPASGEGTSFNQSDPSSPDAGGKNLGSPLCELVLGACTPDDDAENSDGGAELADGGTRCSTEAVDGGAALADASTTTEGCRISKNQSAYVTACATADRRGVDGVSCETGSDCAPGFDCVQGEQGSVCRRYCCSGSCEKQSSQNAGPTFCDVQQLVDFGDHKAPVCMPLKTCKLLREGDCGENETCAVVTEKGDTGCVLTGNTPVGGACDVDHCARNLTCLGSPGDRRCYQLCHVEGEDCGPMQACTTGSVFKDTTFGVCKDD